MDYAHRIPRGKFIGKLPRAVRRIIIDNHDFKREAPSIGRGEYGLDEFSQSIMFVIGWHDHRQVGRGTGGHPSTIIHTLGPLRMNARSLSIAALMALWLLRVPSIAQPMAGDQSLYAYAGQQLIAGHAPYSAAWDQKPPGIHVIYGVFWSIWPHESVVPIADMAATGLVAVLLVVIGRRRFSEGIGFGAAAVFLFFGNPYMVQRLGGAYVRAQCETFILLAVTLAMTLVAAERRTTRHLVGIGVLLGCAFWLKYNAAAYALAIVVAVFVWPRDGEPSWRSGLRDLSWITGAGALTVALPLLAMGMAGAWQDLYLATWTYNVAYSGETFQGTTPLRYLFTFPIERAHNDALWILGGAGAILAMLTWLRSPRSAAALCGLVILSWVAASCLSILINGARDLPQYFIQAAPALAMMAAVGLAPLLSNWRRRPLVPIVTMAVLVAACLRPGESGHLPKLVESTRADWSALTGTTDRKTYLARFGEPNLHKFVASEVEDLAAEVRTTTSPTDSIYVFGFSPGVFVKGERRSASRFHWSRPVVIEFAAGTPGYGSDAVAADLERERPALVALQKRDWGRYDKAVEADSSVFFHRTPKLEAWLTSDYELERETPLFEVWRRR